MTKLQPRTEHVTLGTETIGTINVTPEGSKRSGLKINISAPTPPSKQPERLYSSFTEMGNRDSPAHEDQKSNAPLWLDDTDGGWVPHRLQLLISPAWRHRPKPLARILERLEIEHLTHGGAENGHLLVSYAQFIAFGVSRKAIRSALSAGVALGLLEVIQTDEWVGDIRSPNQYRLTYLPAKDRRAPTDEWASVTDAKAKEVVAAATLSEADNGHSEHRAVAS